MKLNESQFKNETGRIRSGLFIIIFIYSEHISLGLFLLYKINHTSSPIKLSFFTFKIKYGYNSHEGIEYCLKLK